jgi:hypothetical protein
VADRAKGDLFLDVADGGGETLGVLGGNPQDMNSSMRRAMGSANSIIKS